MINNTPDCVFQMYVPFDKTAPSFAPVFEKLKLAPSILGVVFLPVSNTLTSWLKGKNDNLIMYQKTKIANMKHPDSRYLNLAGCMQRHGEPNELTLLDILKVATSGAQGTLKGKAVTLFWEKFKMRKLDKVLKAK